MVSSMISRFLSVVLGVLYPAYGSYRSLSMSQYEEIKKWLVYWVVFAVFTLFEGLTDFFISWLPLYRELKLCIIIWMVAPGCDGSSLLYRHLISPVLEENEGKLLDKIVSSRDTVYHLAVRMFFSACQKIKQVCTNYTQLMVGMKA